MVNRYRVRSLCAGFAIALLAACAPLAPRENPVAAVDVPAAWSATAGGGGAGSTPLADWWLRFSDPALSALVEQAIVANTSVALAQAALQQARATRDAAAAGLSPSLSGSASAQRARRANDTNNNFNAGLDAGWELDLFGANRSNVRAGDATVRASLASLGDARVSVAAEVGLNYIALRSSQARLAIATRNLASQQETLQITQWSQQAGLVSAIEAEQALAAVEQTRAQLPALQTAIDQTRHALAVLTGQPPATAFPLLQATAPVPVPPPGLALAVPAETLRQRADVRATEHQIAAALAQVARAEAQRLPSFRLGGSLGLNALTLGTLTNGASLAAAVLASVSLPIVDGGTALAQVRAQQAALDQARVRYRTAVLTALLDVEDALVALQGDTTRQQNLQAAATAASNAAVLARQRYSAGLVDFQTVLETQRTELSTQDNVATGIAAIGTDHVRLYKALGGGWVPDDDSTANDSALRTLRNPTP
jgi:NodT family efflux transporter outer membrane factor (OMF) lipoprotein